MLHTQGVQCVCLGDAPAIALVMVAYKRRVTRRQARACLHDCSDGFILFQFVLPATQLCHTHTNVSAPLTQNRAAGSNSCASVLTTPTQRLCTSRGTGRTKQVNSRLGNRCVSLRSEASALSAAMVPEARRHVMQCCHHDDVQDFAP